MDWMRLKVGLCRALICVGLVSGACASGERSAPQIVPRELCDGGHGLSLAMRRDGQPSAANWVFRNGSPYLYVQNNCEYWVNSGSWFSFHGLFTPSQAQEVHDLVQYDELSAVGGDWSTPGCFDGDNVTLVAASTETTCACGCEERDTPEAVRTAVAHFGRAVELSVEAGQLFDGPGRAFVFEGASRFGPAPMPWDGSVSLRSLVTPRGATAEQLRDGVLVPADVANAFRSLAHQYVDSGALLLQNDYLKLSADGTDYEVYLVDELPFDTAL